MMAVTALTEHLVMYITVKLVLYIWNQYIVSTSIKIYIIKNTIGITLVTDDDCAYCGNIAVIPTLFLEYVTMLHDFG